MNSPHTQTIRRISGGHTFLVAEDESVVAWDLEELLRDHGAAEVFSCPSIGAARQLLARHDISCAIVDLKLQDGVADELVGEIMGRGIPVIVSTGYSNFERSGVRVLLKPYSSDVLLDAVSAALGVK